MADVVVIGVDCATQAKNVGLARGVWQAAAAGQPTAVTLTHALSGRAVPSIAHTILSWMVPGTPTLLALDAPLGWPEPLGRELHTHAAGEPVTTPPNDLFRRATDRVVKREIGKLPLDVGADRIARTAHMALTLLAELRTLTGLPVPLAWESELTTAVAAIEVYPAGTLAARGWQSSGYKGAAGTGARAALLDQLVGEMMVECATAVLRENDDVLDAAVAVLAGADFLQNNVIRPTDTAVARKEGWIWVRPMTHQA